MYRQSKIETVFGRWRHLLPDGQAGMTLIELVVVLSILAGLATLALTSLGGLGARQRVDTTTRVIDQIELAVAGDGARAGRFVSDMGRLPVLHGAAVARVEGRGLEELWYDLGVYTASLTIQFNGAASWESTNLWPAGSELTGMLPGGWQGPYLDLGGDRLFDGFGNNLKYWDAGTSDWRDTTSADLADQEVIASVASWGSDDAPGGAGWEEEDVESSAFFDAAAVPPVDAAADATLCVSIRVRSHQPPYPWKTPVNGSIADWQTSTAYSNGAIVRAGTTGAVGTTPDDLFICDNGTGSGQSGAVAPFWSRTGTVSDNDLTWRYIPCCDRVDRMRVALLAPYADPNPGAVTPVVRVREILASNDANTTLAVTDSEAGNVSTAVASSWSSLHENTLQNLPPGTRRLYAYGYAQCGTAAANFWSSGLQTIDLKPGINHITVYLSEPL